MSRTILYRPASQCLFSVALIWLASWRAAPAKTGPGCTRDCVLGPGAASPGVRRRSGSAVMHALEPRPCQPPGPPQTRTTRSLIEPGIRNRYPVIRVVRLSPRAYGVGCIGGVGVVEEGEG